MIEQYQKEWISFIRHKRSTYKAYTSSVQWYLTRINKPPLEVTYHEMRELFLQIEKKNTLNSVITAIRQFYLHVLGKELDWRQLPYTAKQKKIQAIYTQQEILKVLQSVKNQKQKAILGLIIDCGLRISEPCTIKIADCNSKQGKIILRGGKGDNDRIIYPSEFAWSLIRKYWKSLPFKPEKYLFEGQHKNTPYTPESIRAFVKEHCLKAGVQYLGIHAIRRFTGTWKVENGVPETVVADSLGHKSVQTLHKYYLIHSPSYLQNTKTPLCRT